MIMANVKIVKGTIFDDGWAERSVTFLVAPQEHGGEFMIQGWAPDFSISMFGKTVTLSNEIGVDRCHLGFGETFSLSVTLPKGAESMVSLEAEHALMPDESDQRERVFVLTKAEVC